MIALRLGLRFSTGGGRTGLWRVLLMVIGVALGVAVALTAWSVPQVLGKRLDRASDRLPVPAASARAATFAFEVSEDGWRDELWTRVLLARASRDAPTPPGLSRFPAPGETFVSPAVAAALREDPALLERVPGRVVGQIGPRGVRGPDELVLYAGVRRGQLPGGGVAGQAFGADQVAETAEAVAQRAVGIELLLLVAAPLIMYLLTCARLSAATRYRRMAALRLLGMRRRTVARAGAVEAATGGILGAALGLLLYQIVAPPLARSGLLGFAWFPQDVTIGVAGSIVVLLIVAAVSARFGVMGARGALTDPLSARRDRPATSDQWWRLIPLVLGLGVLVPFIAMSLVRPDRLSITGGGQFIVLGGSVVASIGLLIAVAPLTVRLARRWAARTDRLAVRLGARRLEHEPTSALRVLAGLVLLVLAGTIGASILRDAALAAGPLATLQRVSVSAGSVAAPDRDAVYGLPAEARIAVLNSTVDPPAPGQGPPTTPEEYVRRIGVTTIFALCEDARILAGSSLPDCRDGAGYRLEDADPSTTANPIPAGVRVNYPADTGPRWTLTTPQRTLIVPDLWRSSLPADSVLVTADKPEGRAWPSATVFTLAVPAEGNALERLQSRIIALAPAAQMKVHGRNLPQLEAYRIHKGAIRLGLTLGFILGLAAFFVAAADRALERRANIAALRVVGTPMRVIRQAQLVQLQIPVVLGLGLAVLVGHLAGLGYLLAGGLQRGWYGGALVVALPLFLAAFILAGATAALVTARRIRVELLRRE